MSKKTMTEAEQKAFEAEMKAAGIKLVTSAPSTVTLLTPVRSSPGRRSGY